VFEARQLLLSTQPRPGDGEAPEFVTLLSPGGIDFGDYDLRLRIARAARRIAQRSISVEAALLFTHRRCQDRLTEGGNPTLR
jgi:hypothetical protein